MPSKQVALITRAALTLVASLKRLGYSCALYGDLACYGHGISCIPQNIEALILAFTPSEERALISVKSQLVQQSEGKLSYFFTASHPESDKVTLLHFFDHSIKGKGKNICPITLSFLNTSMTHLICEGHGLPIAPMSYVILRKLEEWDTSKQLPSESLQIAKPEVIETLLKTADQTGESKLGHLDSALLSSSSGRVHKFISEYPDSASAWRKLGFSIQPLPVNPPSLRQQTYPNPPEPSKSVASPEQHNEREPRTEPPPITNPTRIQMILMAAQESVRLLHKCGWRSVIFGSVACFLYGNLRSPNDVDILVLPPPGSTVSAEDLKQNIAILDPYHFFTISAKHSNASYRILYYRLTDNPSSQTAKTSCKVDIVLPGVMNLPNIPPFRIDWDEGLPLVPFSVLLLQKLQAWDDHRQSQDPIKQQRQGTDLDDLSHLTSLSSFVPLKFSRSWSDEELFSHEFQLLTKARVKSLCSAIPSFKSAWASVGFEV